MKRSVQFWRLTTEDGSALTDRFPATAIVTSLDQAETADANRHRRCRDGMVLLGHGAQLLPFPSLVLDKVRHDNLPSVGDAVGQRRAMGLGDDEGLLEPTYCSFIENNVVAMLASSDGPRPRRLADYINAKFGIPVGLTPVLRQDLDAVLEEMRITSVDISIPAVNITRDLVGGDWVEALNAASQLTQDGLVKVGFSVGRRGTRAQKRDRGDRFRTLIDQLRGSGGLSEFSSAKVSGRINGSQRTVDLIHDKFVQQAEVEADVLSDPVRSVSYACGIIEGEVSSNWSYILESTPALSNSLLPFAGHLIESPDDEHF